MPNALVIKIVGSESDPERTSTALSVAAAAVAAGVEVSLWLAGDAVWLAATGERPTLDEDAAELFAAVLIGAPVAVCARCAARRDLPADALLPGARIEGAAAFVAAVTAPDVRVLVY